MGNNPGLLRAAFESPDSKDNAEAIFRQFDKDKNGVLDKAEYSAFLEAYWTHLLKTHPELRTRDKSSSLAYLARGQESKPIDFMEFWSRLKAHALMLQDASSHNDPILICCSCQNMSTIPGAVPNGALLKCPLCGVLNSIGAPAGAVSGAKPSAAPTAAMARPVGAPGFQGAAAFQAVPAPNAPKTYGFEMAPVHLNPQHPVPLNTQLSPHPQYSPFAPGVVAVASPVASPVSGSASKCLTPGCESFGNQANYGLCNKCRKEKGRSGPASPYPQMASPQMNPQMNPQMMNPQMMNPQMNPQMMNPQMMNPQMMNPQMMNPQMMNPQAPHLVAHMSAPQMGMPHHQLAPHMSAPQMGHPQMGYPMPYMAGVPMATPVSPQMPAGYPPMASPVASPHPAQTPRVEAKQNHGHLSLFAVAEDIFRLLDANGDESIHPREAGFLADLFAAINLRAADGLMKELRDVQKQGDEQKKSLSRKDMLEKIERLPEPAMREVHAKLYALDWTYRTELLSALFREWDADHNHRIDANEAQLFAVIAQTKIDELFKGRDPELATKLEAKVGLFIQEVAKCRGGITLDLFIQFWMSWSLVHLYAVFHDVCPAKVFSAIDNNPFGAFAKHQVEFALEHCKKLAFQSTGLYLLFEKGDGNCLFRSVARIIKGDPDVHFVSVRLEAAQLMKTDPSLNPGGGFYPEIWGFPSYDAFIEARLNRKRWERGCVGNKKDWGFDPDLQALCTLYQRPLLIYRQNHSAQKRGPDMTLYPTGKRKELYAATRPINLYYTGCHYQSLVHDPDFVEPMGPGPDPLSKDQVAALEKDMQELQVKAALPEWTCDFCLAKNPGASDSCSRCHVKHRK